MATVAEIKKLGLTELIDLAGKLAADQKTNTALLDACKGQIRDTAKEQEASELFGLDFRSVIGTYRQTSTDTVKVLKLLLDMDIPALEPEEFYQIQGADMLLLAQLASFPVAALKKSFGGDTVSGLTNVVEKQYHIVSFKPVGGSK